MLNRARSRDRQGELSDAFAQLTLEKAVILWYCSEKVSARQQSQSPACGAHTEWKWSRSFPPLCSQFTGSTQKCGTYTSVKPEDAAGRSCELTQPLTAGFLLTGRSEWHTSMAATISGIYISAILYTILIVLSAYQILDSQEKEWNHLKWNKNKFLLCYIQSRKSFEKEPCPGQFPVQ